MTSVDSPSVNFANIAKINRTGSGFRGEVTVGLNCGLGAGKAGMDDATMAMLIYVPLSCPSSSEPGAEPTLEQIEAELAARAVQIAGQIMSLGSQGILRAFAEDLDRRRKMFRADPAL